MDSRSHYSSAVLDAYRNLLMHGEYPQVSLKIDLDPSEVDVNVHPSKSQVKWRDSGSIYKLVNSTLRKGLETSPWLDKMMSHSVPSESRPHFFQGEIISSGAMPTQFATKAQEFSHKINEFEFLNPTENLDVNTSKFKIDISKSGLGLANGISEKWNWSQLQVLAQVNLTYILAQSQQAMFLIDQHAAHERINFETLMSAWKKGGMKGQRLLLPYTFDLTAEEIELLMSESERFSSLGIDIKAIGPQSIQIESSPELLKVDAVIDMIQKHVEELRIHGGSHSLDKTFSDRAALLACHSSVRGGDVLSFEEMKNILKRMDDFQYSSFCPHGRPVYIEYPFGMLEKNFGRTL